MEGLELRLLMSGSPATDMVVRWDNVTIDVLRADRTLPGPTWASRTFAIESAAVFDAVNAIDGSYEPYVFDGQAPRGASMAAAIAAAAHAVLVAIYPQQRVMLDQAYQQSLATVQNSPAKTKGIVHGEKVAQLVLNDRRRDGSDANPTYTSDGLPGHWESDPLNPGQHALGVAWGDVDPFTMTGGSQFRPPHPPDMTSAAYTAAFNEVKSLGEKNSLLRTAEQTEIGIFWGYDRAGLGAPPSLYNQIVQTIAAQEHNTMVENARLFALANLAQADAGIAAWECKYVDNFWRPVTAIRRAAEDGNPDTTSDANWEPLGAPGGGVVNNFTPPFPAYVSGHATFGAAVFRVLADFYGTDVHSFTVRSDELPNVTRSFESFSDAAAENARSRIYLGIHWNFDDSEGQALGRQVADWTIEHALQPRSGHGSVAPYQAALFGVTPIARSSLIDSIDDSTEAELA
jgi:hypothetical protein